MIKKLFSKVKKKQVPEKLQTKGIVDGYVKKVKYDNNGNVIYSSDPSGLEVWKVYDDRNNCIAYKNSYGKKKWHQYDNLNRLVYTKFSDGFEERYEYTENGYIQNTKYADGFTETRKYENDILVYYNDSNNQEWHF